MVGEISKYLCKGVAKREASVNLLNKWRELKYTNKWRYLN